MATSITYGSYSFPDPLPLVAEEDEAISIAGLYDHSAIRVNLVGYLTGSSLSGLNYQKNQMISGFLDEYQDLTITVENNTKTCPKAFIDQLSFDSSDLTTFLPYSLSFLYYSGETFSDYFKIADPQNNWSFDEQDGGKVNATHTVSAKGLTIGSSSEIDNARYFVDAKIAEGFSPISLFNSGTSDAYLVSRSENIDEKSNTYSITENYIYSTSPHYSENELFSNISGIVDIATSIGYGEPQGLSVTVQGSVQGNINANTGSQDGLLSTGDFTLENATEVAINAIVNSYSDYESGVYSFVSSGPNIYSYNLDTGANTLSFSFQFIDADNLDIINDDVVHKYSTSVSVSKDSPVVNISIQGNLSYLGSEFISATGEFENSNRYKAVSGAFEEVNPENIAKEALDDFTGVATEYAFKSSYLNTGERNFNIVKNPVDNTISYSYNYSNQFDYSSGALTDFQFNVTDQRPLQLSAVQETISGYAAQEIMSRSLGIYSISAQSNDGPEKLSTLKDIVSGLCSGSYIISESYQTGSNNISYNLSKNY